MFIAHAPAGYILGSGIAERLRNLPLSAKCVIGTCLFGALAPDLDMFYFYLVDHRQTHHHKYITHWPLLWIALLTIAGFWKAMCRKSRAAVVVVLFSFSATIHMIMDTVVGDIWWLAPFVDKPFAAFKVQAIFRPWWLNFILHWSFAVELAILCWAILRFRRRSNTQLGTDSAHRSA